MTLWFASSSPTRNALPADGTGRGTTAAPLSIRMVPVQLKNRVLTVPLLGHAGRRTLLK